jgi:hypothetical protein
LGFLESLNGNLPNKMARMPDGIYVYEFNDEILHKMEVRDYRILWSEPITQGDLDEREQQIRTAISADLAEYGKEPDGENGDSEKNFGHENQGYGCSQAFSSNQEHNTDNRLRNKDPEIPIGGSGQG